MRLMDCLAFLADRCNWHDGFGLDILRHGRIESDRGYMGSGIFRCSRPYRRGSHCLLYIQLEIIRSFVFD